MKRPIGHIAKTSLRATILFLASLLLIVMSGVGILTYIVVTNPENAVLLIAAVGGMMTGLLTSVITLIALLVQVRSEVNHKLDQYIQARGALRYNEGMEASERGDTLRQTGDEDRTPRTEKDADD